MAFYPDTNVLNLHPGTANSLVKLPLSINTFGVHLQPEGAVSSLHVCSYTMNIHTHLSMWLVHDVLMYVHSGLFLSMFFGKFQICLNRY